MFFESSNPVGCRFSEFFTEQRNKKSNTDRKAAKTGITEREVIKIAPEHLKIGAPARDMAVFSLILVRFGALKQQNG